MTACCCDERPPSPLLSEPSNPKPLSIPAESWREAERAACGVVRRIQPTRRSQGRRRDVVEYVQGVIRTRLGSEAFPFGSVPLKTYLPDGDIDLTALGAPNSEETLSVNVRAILEEEEHSSVAPFEVRDVQYIHAEVKLVKCLVQNIIVDISFNQIGGLCTLCFLEQVDNLIGKDHLFKRSIILIKAWCYYESRILGAHHSLISTYALETLVLYIFHLYNSSLNGPIAVLYRFLDYFSKFDWDNFCISLHGPVPISSLPEIVAEMPVVDDGDLLLTPEFLNRCAEMFSVPPRFSENNHRIFVKKYLNIVDPLKENNNLGRSVSKGNLYRIRSAFAYGARKLGQILLLQRECMEEELNKFFRNTLERHGDGERPDVQGNCNRYPDRGISVINSENGSALPRNILDKQESLISQSHNNIYKESQDHLDEAKSPLPLRENVPGEELHQDSRLQDKYLQPCSNAKRESSNDKKDLSSSCLAGVSTNILATCEKSNSRGNTHANADAVTLTKINHAPHLFFHQDNGEVTVSSGPSEQPPSCPQVHHVDIIDDDAETNGQGLTPYGCDLADLSGDHENHIKNLQYSQWCHEYFLNGCVSLGKPFFLPSLLDKQQWDAVSQHDIFRNGLVQSSPFSRVSNHYQLKPNLVSASYNVDDMPKPRGTGMYLANMNYRGYRDTPPPAGGRNLVPAIPGPRSRSSGPKNPEAHSADLSGRELVPQAQHKVNDRHSSFEPSHASDPFLKGFPQSKRNTSPSEGQLEIGGLGSVLISTSNLEPGRSDSDDAQGSRVTSPAKLPLDSPNNRRPDKLYHLKDDEEFPPLSNRGHRNTTRSVYEIRK